MSRRLLSGHEVKQESEEVVSSMEIVPFQHGLVRILPEGWLYPGTAPTFLDKIQTMKFRDDDVLVVTFPKCGTTWMQEILWTMLHNPNLDNPEADEAIWLRSPELSQDMTADAENLGGRLHDPVMKQFEEMCPGMRVEDGVSLQIIDAMPGPRILKNHYPLSILPQDILQRAKVVYVTRNPKDMMVSMYWFFKNVSVYSYRGSFKNLVKLLMSGSTLFCPFWPHVKEAWQKRHHPNLHFVFYEDMKTDILLELRKLNEFLGTRLSEKTLEGVARHTSFSAMKSVGDAMVNKLFNTDNESEGTFFRNGMIGDWKKHFSPELQKEVDGWTKKNLVDSDLSLSWALAE